MSSDIGTSGPFRPHRRYSEGYQQGTHDAEVVAKNRENAAVSNARHQAWTDERDRILHELEAAYTAGFEQGKQGLSRCSFPHSLLILGLAKFQGYAWDAGWTEGHQEWLDHCRRVKAVIHDPNFR